VGALVKRELVCSENSRGFRYKSCAFDIGGGDGV